MRRSACCKGLDEDIPSILRGDADIIERGMSPEDARYAATRSSAMLRR